MTELRYVTFECGPWVGTVTFLTKLLSRILPQANPDFEDAYRTVTHWWLEIDDAGNVHREIGFDPSGQAIAVAPFRENFGIFTDSGSPVVAEESEIDPQQFSLTWDAFVQRFAA